jgi:hypothetical protein
MIGQAIYNILTTNVEELKTGKNVYPVVMAQNTQPGLSYSYPAVIYTPITTYELSKDKMPGALIAEVQISIFTESYKETANLASSIRAQLDHFKDTAVGGLSGVPGYTDDNGYTHSIIANTDINHIFFEDEEYEFLKDLYLSACFQTYKIYYFDDIIKLSYGENFAKLTTAPNSPLTMAIDCTQNKLMRGMNDIIPVSDGTFVEYVYNKLGNINYANQNNSTDSLPAKALKGQYQTSPGKYPAYSDGVGVSGGIKKNLFIEEDAFMYIDNTGNKVYGGYGMMIVLVYKPTAEGANNWIVGNGNSAISKGIIIEHKKEGANITIRINTAGDFSETDATQVLLTSTNSFREWAGNYHYLCVSLCGNKAETGGSVNSAGWFDYFNSNSLSSKLYTTGQIEKENQITGNTLTQTQPQWFSGFGSSTELDSAGFRIYECLVFTPSGKQKHASGGYDVAPYQPTDIIYNQVKDYIFNKYGDLKI